MQTNAPTTNGLSEEDILALRRNVFRNQALTLDAAGRQAGVPNLSAAIRTLRSGMRPLLETLPDSAFAPQPDTADGALVWSAGQVFGHVCDVQVHIWGAWLRAAAGLPAGVSVESHQSEHAAYPHLSRAACLALDDSCTAELQATLDAIGPDADPAMGSPLENPWVSTLAETLLMLCIHEQDHLAQLRNLGSTA